MSQVTLSGTWSGAGQRTASLECVTCGIRFSRTSHLKRHNAQHLPDDDKVGHRCNKCGKSFSRRDVLLRHQKTAHQPKRANPQSLRRSCKNCIERKLRCDRSQPCGNCTKKGGDCGYSSSGIIFDDEDCFRSIISADLQSVQCEVLNHSSEPIHTAGNRLELRDWGSQHVNGREFQALKIDKYSTELADTDQSDFSETRYQFDGSSNCVDQDMLFQWPLPALPMSDVDFGCLDWLNFDIASPEEDLAPSHLDGVRSRNRSLPQLESNTQSELRMGYQTNHDSQQSSKFDSTTRSPSSKTNNGAASHITMQNDTGEQWPFDNVSKPEPRKVKLPPLRQMLLAGNMSSARRGKSDNVMVNSLIEILSSRYLPKVDETTGSNFNRAIPKLQCFLELYISEFHSILPLIHVPTWQMASCPTILLAAMACIGALFSEEEGAIELSWSLSEISLQALSWLGESDSANSRDPVYVSACCLHQIYSLGSGNRRLYESADGSRGALMTSLRGMGLLRPRLSLDGDGFGRSDPPTPRISNAASIPTEWKQWRDREMAKRITWSAFEYDCSLCTLTSRRGAVDLHELPDYLPCAEVYWDSPSGQAWSLLLQSNASPVNGYSTSSVLREIYAQRPIAEAVSGWGKRVCTQIIGRLLWDLHRIERVSTLSYLGLPSLVAAHKPTKDVLLRCLANLSASISSPSCPSDLIHLNIISLICHYSHLYTSEEAMDLVMFIFRGNAQENKSKQADAELEVAKERLRSVFTRNRQETRAMVWHAAQIIGVAKEYFIHAPCETMRVFMGHIFLLAYAKYGCEIRTLGDWRNPVKLDQTYSSPTQKYAVNQWIEVGGAASVGSVTDISDSAQLGALKLGGLQMMREMRVWGLAKKFYKVLEGFQID